MSGNFQAVCLQHHQKAPLPTPEEEARLYAGRAWLHAKGVWLYAGGARLYSVGARLYKEVRSYLTQ